jgi:hypothetical protein
MSTANTPAPVPRNRVVIDAGRLWGGGVATATGRRTCSGRRCIDLP